MHMYKVEKEVGKKIEIILQRQTKNNIFFYLFFLYVHEEDVTVFIVAKRRENKMKYRIKRKKRDKTEIEKKFNL